jgi:hypothetical protein
MMRRILFASILVFLMGSVATANGLSEALDTDLIFDTGGDADWFSQPRNFYFDGDAATGRYLRSAITSIWNFILTEYVRTASVGPWTGIR